MKISNASRSISKFLAAVFLGASFINSIPAAQPTSVSGYLPAAVASAPMLGQLDGATQLKLAISLPLHNQEALSNLLEQLYNPASSAFHRYLTPEEFDARFGPTEQDYQKVVDWATASGFTITARHPNRMLLEVSAAVADINRALQVTLRNFSHPTEARIFYAPDVEPTMDASLPIAAIGGLDNFNRPHPKNLRRAPLNSSAKVSAKTIGSGPNGNLAGFDYRAAYVPGSTLTGSGQIVGLLEFDGYYATDIASYESLAGVPNVPLQNVLIGGFSGVPTTGANSGNGEVALDIEVAISLAPGLSKVVVYEADPSTGQPNALLQAMSTNTLIKQFSCSWSFGSVTSSQRTAMDNYFQKFATQGQSFFDASGDAGALSGAISPPDDDPYITIVGGTTLATAGPGGAWLSETVWNAQYGSGSGSSGGGSSTTYNIPTWQQGINMTASHGSTTKRNTPDVAMVADNIFIFADNGQQETTGGTSAAAPLWAAFAALANQQSVAAGGSTIGFINPAIYSIATNSSYASCFNDITIGNNTNNIATQFVAVPGYDLCTGLGSPTGNSLIVALTQPDGFQITPGRGAVANGPVGGPFTISTQTFSLTNNGKPAFNWSLGNTSTWLNVSSSSGSLGAGGGATLVSLAVNSSASFFPAGVYTANVAFTNLTSGLSQIRQFTLQVSQELVQDGGFETGDFTYWTLSGGAGVYTNDFVDGGYAYAPFAGNYYAALGQVTTLAYLSQPLPTLAGQVYLLSLELENPTNATANQFTVQWNTNTTSVNTIFNQSNMGIFGWSNLLFTVRATTNLTTLRIGARNDADYFALDNVSVMPAPLPTVQATAPVNGAFNLFWPALSGLKYQVQYKTNLAQPVWVNLSSVITATANPQTFSNNLAADPQRFYRIVLLP